MEKLILKSKRYKIVVEKGRICLYEWKKKRKSKGEYILLDEDESCSLTTRADIIDWAQNHGSNENDFEQVLRIP